MTCFKVSLMWRLKTPTDKGQVSSVVISLCQNCVLPPVIYWCLLVFTGSLLMDKHHK